MMLLVLSLSSAFFLFLSFPPCDLPFFAWVALIPLFLFLRKAGAGTAFLASQLAGFLFLNSSQWWIAGIEGFNTVSFLVWHIYLSFYFGLFGLIAQHFQRTMPRWNVLTFPAVWVVLEYLRSHVGFLSWPWVLLGYSQYRVLPALGVAAFTGVYGISFLIVCVNAVITSLIPSPLLFLKKDGSRESAEWQHSGRTGAIVTLATVFLVLGAGLFRAQTRVPTTKKAGLQVALIQGNDAIREKTEREGRLQIFQMYKDLSLRTAPEKPDLIVWPSACIPGELPLERGLVRDLGELARKTQAYLLVGSRGFDKFNKEQAREKKATNSAFLFSPEGRIVGRYDKVRLFPFGEYYPLRGRVRWPSWVISPDLQEPLPGKQLSLFTMGELRFGVLICWENYFPEHFREMAGLGTDFIVSMSNDSFVTSRASRHQMLAMNVLRAAENGVPVIRINTTGVSSVITPGGRIAGKVAGIDGRDVDVAGRFNARILPASQRTFYCRRGNLFFGAVFLLFVFAAFVSFLPRTPGRNGQRP